MLSGKTPIRQILAEADPFGKLVLVLILCFPIFSLSVRHWLSGIYALLIVFSLILLFRKHQRLFPEEKILLTLVMLLILSFFLSATLNHWSVNSIRRLGEVAKYIFFFPLYLLVRRYPQALLLLLIGIMLGSFVLGLQSLYDIAFRPHQQGWGIYGPIIFGDLAVLFFSLLLLIFIFNRNYLINPPLLGIAVLFAILAGILSGSRNAWAAAIFSSLLVAFLGSRFIKIKYLVLAVISLVIVAVAILSAYKPLQERMILAYQQTYTFISEGAPRDIPLAGNSVGTRLEQWRSALQIYKDSPLFGFGGGNAAKEVNRFVKKGLAHPDLYNIDSETNIGGLHSTYFETLVNEGLIGLGIVLLFLCYPLYIFIKTRKRDPLLSSIGIIFISNYLVFGVSENPLVHDNFTSVYLLLLAVFFSTAIHSLHTAANTAKPRSDSTAKNSRHASTA